MEPKKIGLEDTIGLMCSDDYKDRLKAEYMQLMIRLSRMDEIQMADYSFGTRYLFWDQAYAMERYRDVLRQRMDDEDLDWRAIDNLIFV